MATIFTSNYSGGYGGKYEFKVEATESKAPDYISTNKTTVTAKAYVRRTDSSSAGAYNLNGTAWSITIDGTTTSGTSSWDTRNTSEWQLLGTATKEITHNPDGSKTITISASHTGNSASGSSKMGNASGSGTFILITIPRASSVSGGSGDIGSKPTISISRKNSSFTHTITYVFGSLSGTIATKTTATSITSWEIPDSFYTQIPNDPSGTGTIRCYTYDGDTLIKTSNGADYSTCTFTANTVESVCKPIVTATLTDINAKTANLIAGTSTVSNKLVANKSTAQLVINTTLNKSAGSIKSVTVNGTNIGTSTSITKDYANVTATKFEIKVTDIRNYSTTYTFSAENGNLTIINYVPLTLNANFFRPQPTTGEVQLTYSGNYFSGSFGNVSNALSITWKYKVQGASSWSTGGTITPSISGTTISSATISLGTIFDYQTAYDFQVIATDKLTTVTRTASVSTGMPVFYWGKDFFRILSKVIIDKQVNVKGTAGEKPFRVRGIVGSDGTGADGELHLQYGANSPIKLGNTAGYSISADGSFYSGTAKSVSGTVLYNNSSGTTGTITLSETAYNFSYLEIYFGCHGTQYSSSSAKIASPDGKQCSLSTVTFDTASTNPAYINNTKLMTISGTSITVNSYERMWFYKNDTKPTVDTQNNIVIYKVVGYK